MAWSRWSAAWGLGAFALYAATAARGPMWADSSKLTLYALAGYLPSLNPGDHAGWTALAKVWLTITPGLDPVASLHLMSAAAGAWAVAAAFLLVYTRTADKQRAHTVAGLLLVAHPLWWAATLTETYAVALAASLTAVLLTGRGEGPIRKAGGGFLAGTALACHAFSFVLLLPLLGSVRRRILPLILGALLGSAPVWLALCVGSPADPMTGHHAGSGESWAWHVAAFLTWRRAGRGLLLVSLWLLFGLGPVGLTAVAGAFRRGPSRLPLRTPAVLLLTGFLMLLTMYAPFRLHLMMGFFLTPVLVLLAPTLSNRWRTVHLTVQLLLYLGVPALATRAGVADLGQRRLPERNNAWYFLCPIKALETGPAQYAAAVARCVAPGDVLLADFNPGAVLALLRSTGKERLPTVVPTAVDDALTAADPGRALDERLGAVLTAGQCAVLADTWEPYYRLAELARRFERESTPCGPTRRYCSPAPRASLEPTGPARHPAPGSSSPPS